MLWIAVAKETPKEFMPTKIVFNHGDDPTQAGLWLKQLYPGIKGYAVHTLGRGANNNPMHIATEVRIVLSHEAVQAGTTQPRPQGGNGQYAQPLQQQQFQQPQQQPQQPGGFSELPSDAVGYDSDDLYGGGGSDPAFYSEPANPQQGQGYR